MKKPTLVPEPDGFHLRRRQQFLYSALYRNVRNKQLENISIWRSCLPKREQGSLSQVNDQAFVYHESFWLWMLDYTAGEDLDALAPRLASVVDEFVLWNEVNKPFLQRLADKYPERGPINLNTSAVDFDNQIWYEDALQLVSVAIMLRDARSVKRIIRAMDSNRGQDALYEELIASYADEYYEVEDALHDEPYPTLLQAFLEPDLAQALVLIKSYLKNWYKAQDGARWYNSHQKIVEDSGWYYGYWAFEAGAACYLLNIDDSTIDHMVYPKHLVAYGRKLREEGRWTSPDDEPLEASTTEQGRCEAGQPCPRAGFWFTPAKADSRRHFKAGDVMPEVGGDYGSTIWQWDINQEPPKFEQR